MKKIFLLLALVLCTCMSAQAGFIKQVSTATTGQTITAQDTQQDVIVFHNSNTLALTMTFNFPANPKDGQMVILCSKSGITSLSLVTTAGTILGGITGISIVTPGTWIWFADLSTWVRTR